MGLFSLDRLVSFQNRQRARECEIVAACQWPSDAKGALFITLEYEAESANGIFFDTSGGGVLQASHGSQPSARERVAV